MSEMSEVSEVGVKWKVIEVRGVKSSGEEARESMEECK